MRSLIYRHTPSESSTNVNSVTLLIAAALTLCLGACSDNNNSVPVADPAATGIYAVGHTTMSFIDELRGNRVLPAEIWYPADAADTEGAMATIYPLQGNAGIESPMAFEGIPIDASTTRGLLVFSHGFGGTKDQSTPLMEHLASHGFVVVAPEHTGNTSSDNSDSGAVAAANRVPDISFIIDSMLELNDPDMGMFSGSINPERIGVLGHSGGGFTSMGVAAGYEDTPADPRVKAIMPISGVILDAYSAEDMAGVEIPVLLLGGTLDTSVPIENNDFAFMSLVNSPQVIQIDIIGATHTHFANICGIGNWLIDNGLTMDIWPIIGAAALIGPYMETCSEDAFPIEKAVRLQNLYAAAFFRLHLFQERGYEAYLDENAAAAEPDVIYNAKIKIALKQR
ncbi:alpha/beta fold hydrolase [Halieaceae bacterium IMCC14734]|uniref:Alpha/beta fold hydrolase n=1 Tax=Candidatus Litorirhabdus singularis TaxID=2518993 RepID=A0ABT3TM92_9GAMM|nr:alpha/beta fold hydrolase [Candidatus Litorirhabdus singularis]MCX2983376.1 alpha/beta fold hydrolase [Candidatus Litorirhabdus singularis]